MSSARFREILGSSRTSVNVREHCQENGLTIGSELWNSDSDNDFPGASGQTLTVVTGRGGNSVGPSFMGITSLDLPSYSSVASPSWNRMVYGNQVYHEYRRDPSAVLFVGIGSSRVIEPPGFGLVLTRGNYLPSWGTGASMQKMELYIRSEREARFKSQTVALQSIRIYQLVPESTPEPGITATQCLAANLHIPMDEFDLAQELKTCAIHRPNEETLIVRHSHDISGNSSHALLSGCKCLQLAVTIDRKAVAATKTVLKSIFSDRKPISGRLSQPHTLVVDSPNEPLLAALFEAGGCEVPGLARLVVNKTSDLTRLVELVSKTSFLEELVLPQGHQVTVSCPWKMVKALTKLQSQQAIRRDNYEDPPPKVQERILASQIPVAPLVDIPDIPSSSPMFLQCGTKAWALKKSQQTCIGMLAKVLGDSGETNKSHRKRNREEVKCAPASAGIMDPMPGEKAGALAQHFVKHFITSDQNVDENSPWPASFETFYSQHIEPTGETDAEVRKACWLLGELWGIASYLQIEELQKFCRAAWVVMTGGAD